MPTASPQGPRSGGLNLQIVAEAMAAFSASSNDPLLDRKVQRFDFAGMVNAFDAARGARRAGLR